MWYNSILRGIENKTIQRAQYNVNMGHHGVLNQSVDLNIHIFASSYQIKDIRKINQEEQKFALFL